MKTVALFGGSFDPPHTGHLAIVHALQKLDFIDEIVVMPTYLNPFKSAFHADAHTRLKWLKKMFEGYEDVVVDAFEVRQQRKVPSIESVRHLQESYDAIYLVIGADNLATLQQWHAYEQLKEMVRFIVVTRDKVEIPQQFFSLDVDEDISSTALRKKLDTHFIPPQIAQEVEKFYKENNGTKN